MRSEFAHKNMRKRFVDEWIIWMKLHVFSINQFCVCIYSKFRLIWRRKLYWSENLTGGLGQLGIECAKLLRSRYGSQSVILSDIVKPSDEIMENGPYIFCDILDFKVNSIVFKN